MDFGLLFRNIKISAPFELEKVEFGILVPGIPLPEKSQKECGHKIGWLCLSNSDGSLGHVKRAQAVCCLR